MDIEIKEVRPIFPEYEAMWRMRHEILRVPLGLELKKQDVIQEECNQIHLGAFKDDELVGCLLLVPLEHAMKLRQMAVVPQLRGRGISKMLLAAAEKIARMRGCKELIGHARENVVNFYKRFGYQVEGERFIEVTIPHFKMRKQLQQ
jgi:predicted GNAT family N-acyltransferase